MHIGIHVGALFFYMTFESVATHIFSDSVFKDLNSFHRY